MANTVFYGESKSRFGIESCRRNGLNGGRWALTAAAVALAMGTFAGSVTVAECPTSDCRMRITPDGSKATINLCRLKDDNPSEALLAQRVEAMKARAQMLMERAADAVTAAPGRPLMGWASWNAFGCDISEELIRSQAEVMATNGLKAAGYRYINIDDGSFGGRAADGHILPNPNRFPRGFKALVTRIHELGLKAGTYSDAGDSTCAGLFNGDKLGLGTGLYRHEKMDAEDRFVKDGFDFIKVDWCGGRKLNLDRREQYTRIAEAMRGTGRTDLHLNICCWTYPGTWVDGVAGSWRVKGDIRANWRSLRAAVLDNLYRSGYCSFGHYNDMDMMQVGRLVGQTKQARFREFRSDTGLTPAEETTHFALWCMLSSPLMIGCDLREMPASTLKLLTNRFLLGTSQNDLGLAAYVARREGDVYLLVKDADARFGRARQIAVFNAGDAERTVSVQFADVDLGGSVAAFDLLECVDIGAFENNLSVRVPAHGTRVLRLDAERRLERTVYEAETARLSRYGQQGHVGTYGHKGASGDVRVGYIGNSEANDLVWKDVKVDRVGRRTLEFRFASCEDRFFFVQIDGGERHRVEAKYTHGGFGTSSLTLDLAPGVHTVRISNPNAWAPDLDAMFLR